MVLTHIVLYFENISYQLITMSKLLVVVLYIVVQAYAQTGLQNHNFDPSQHPSDNIRFPDHALEGSGTNGFMGQPNQNNPSMGEHKSATSQFPFNGHMNGESKNAPSLGNVLGHIDNLNGNHDSLSGSHKLESQGAENSHGQSTLPPTNNFSGNNNGPTENHHNDHGQIYHPYGSDSGSVPTVNKPLESNNDPSKNLAGLDGVNGQNHNHPYGSHSNAGSLPALNNVPGHSENQFGNHAGIDKPLDNGHVLNNQPFGNHGDFGSLSSMKKPLELGNDPSKNLAGLDSENGQSQNHPYGSHGNTGSFSALNNVPGHGENQFGNHAAFDKSLDNGHVLNNQPFGNHGDFESLSSMNKPLELGNDPSKNLAGLDSVNGQSQNHPYGSHGNTGSFPALNNIPGLNENQFGNHAGYDKPFDHGHVPNHQPFGNHGDFGSLPLMKSPPGVSEYPSGNHPSENNFQDPNHHLFGSQEKSVPGLATMHNLPGHNKDLSKNLAGIDSENGENYHHPDGSQGDIGSSPTLHNIPEHSENQFGNHAEFDKLLGGDTTHAPNNQLYGGHGDYESHPLLNNLRQHKKNIAEYLAGLKKLQGSDDGHGQNRDSESLPSALSDFPEKQNSDNQDLGKDSFLKNIFGQKFGSEDQNKLCTHGLLEIPCKIIKAIVDKSQELVHPNAA